jgi:hypothetical protein
MKSIRRSALLLTLVTLPACGQQLVEFSNSDGARQDTAKADVVLPDVVSLDVPVRDVDDARSGEVGNSETGAGEAGIGDSVKRDTGGMDGAKPDVAITDSPNVDAPASDGATMDTRTVDAPRSDVANSEAGGMDGSRPAIVVELGLAAPFAIAATAGVTNTITSPITHINGNVVLTPNQTCNAVTVDNAGGFGLCGGMAPTIAGTVLTNVYPDTTTAAAIKADLNAAFLRITPLAGPPAVGSLGGGIAIAAPTTLGDVAGSPLVLGDNWFVPGVYLSSTSVLITGDVTLDGQGDTNATFVFQSASSLTTADGAASPGAHVRILLINGAKASNVWWLVH